MYVALMLTMLLGGLWHGAATKFIIWGGLHGAALAIHKLWMRYFPKISNVNTFWSKFFTTFVTFHFVAFCWIYFRAGSLAKVKLMLNQIFTRFNVDGISERIYEFRIVFGLILLGFAIHFLPSEWKERVKGGFVVMPDVVKVLVALVVIFICYQAKTADVQPFIYFQF